MSSPFKFFRHHQKQMLAALVVLAMFAFIVGDPLMKMFGGRGHDGGEAAGAAVVTLSKDGGKLTRREIADLRGRRRIANEFIRQAMFETRPPETFPLGKVNPQMGMQQLGNAIYSEQFRYLDNHPDRISENDVVLGYLLRKEAERMGAIISNEAITKYIENLTHGKLSKRKLDNILAGFQQSPPMNELRLYDILRDELLARLAYAQTFPTVLPAPEKYWDYYKRLHESQKIEAIVVPAADFVSKIKTPDDATLRAFFEEHKAKPSTENLGEEFPPLTFYQPDRLSIQDLRLKFSDVEANVAKSQPVTDQDIVAYYEKNKSFYEERPSMIGSDASPPLGTNDPIDPLFAPGGSKKLSDGPVLPLAPGSSQPPASKGPEVKNPAAKGPDSKTTETKAPAKVETPAVPKPSTNIKGVDSKDAGKTPPAKVETKGTDAKETEKTPDKAKTPVATPPARKQSRALRHPRTVLAAFGGNQPEKSTTAAKADSKPSEKPVTKPAEKAAEKTAEKPVEKATPQPPAAGKEAPPAKAEPATKPASTPEKEKTPAATKSQPDVKPAVPGAAEKAPGAGELAPLPAKKYRPLDAKLKDEIRKNVAKERAFEEMQKIADQVLTDLRRAYSRLDQQFQLLRLRDEDRPKLMAAAKAEMEKIAKKFNLTFGETPMLNSLEFRDKTGGLGQATELMGGQFQQPMTLIQRLFSSVETFVPGQAEDITTSDRYFYWKVDFKPEHVPTFDEPGVKQQVLDAWKLKQAEPLAKKRAEELVSILSKGNKPAAETLGKTTVTGDADSKQIAVVDVPSFTWLQVPSANSGTPGGQRQQVQLTSIPQIEKGGTEFRELVYYTLSPGQWGSAPAVDKSAYYVVKLVSRHVPKEEELMQTPLFASPELVTWLGYSPYEQLSMMDTNALRRQYFKQLEKSYGVKWSEKDKEEGNSEPVQDDSSDS